MCFRSRGTLPSFSLTTQIIRQLAFMNLKLLGEADEKFRTIKNDESEVV